MLTDEEMPLSRHFFGKIMSNHVIMFIFLTGKSKDGLVLLLQAFRVSIYLQSISFKIIK
jgi:hypothetical protein